MATANFCLHTKGIRSLSTQEDTPFLVIYEACYIIFQLLYAYHVTTRRLAPTKLFHLVSVIHHTPFK